MASDYIKFIKNFKYYIDINLTFISPHDSKNYTILVKDKNFGEYPIGKLGDIEIYFLHYASEKEAYEKWTRRCKRINYDNIIYKFNDQNNCDLQDIKEFCNLEYKNKLFFTIKDWGLKYDCIYKFNQIFNKKCINASNEPFGNNSKINITRYLNNIKGEKL